MSVAVGLLGFYLRERGFENPIVGFDRDARKIRVALEMAGAYSGVDLRTQDLYNRVPEFSGTIAMLDVLHYLPPVEQSNLLFRLAEQIGPGAMLILRDCPCDVGIRYAATVLAEICAANFVERVDAALLSVPRKCAQEFFA